MFLRALDADLTDRELRLLMSYLFAWDVACTGILPYLDLMHALRLTKIVVMDLNEAGGHVPSQVFLPHYLRSCLLPDRTAEGTSSGYMNWRIDLIQKCETSGNLQEFIWMSNFRPQATESADYNTFLSDNRVDREQDMSWELSTIVSERLEYLLDQKTTKVKLLAKLPTAYIAPLPEISALLTQPGLEI